MLKADGLLRDAASIIMIHCRSTWLPGCKRRGDSASFVGSEAWCLMQEHNLPLAQVPQQFCEDLFSVLGESNRPDYRWLIMGPERSGSSFHKDPNATAAWNAVVKGSKKWVLFPPHVTPPGQRSELFVHATS